MQFVAAFIEFAYQLQQTARRNSQVSNLRDTSRVEKRALGS